MSVKAFTISAKFIVGLGVAATLVILAIKADVKAAGEALVHAADVYGKAHSAPDDEE